MSYQIWEMLGAADSPPLWLMLLIVPLYIGVGLAIFIFWIWMVVDAARYAGHGQKSILPYLLWFAANLVLWPVAPLLYFFTIRRIRLAKWPEAKISFRKGLVATGVAVIVMPIIFFLTGIVEDHVNKRTLDLKQAFRRPPLDWPVISEILEGPIEVRVSNPNYFQVRVGLRSDDRGRDFIVQPDSSESVGVPSGSYDIYFQYSNNPKALFQGDSFTLSNNGIEIKIVEVFDGNYNIRKIR